MPPPDSHRSQLSDIFALYASISAAIPCGSEAASEGLGGKLFYAGELSSRNPFYAANIAGAASIGASADPAIQRQAIRDGAIDFLVTSLEEALRILKNEIRKHEAVSVGVGIAPNLLVNQMLDRGVLPDLLVAEADMSPEQEAKFLSQGALKIGLPGPSAESFVTWSVERDFARSLLQLDALVRAVIPEQDLLRQRWMRLAPRYLGRAAQRIHGVVLSDREFATVTSSFADWHAKLSAETGQSIAPAIEKFQF